MICPKCGEECSQDAVDIGVGTMYGPARCDSCGWTQDAGMDELVVGMNDWE